MAECEGEIRPRKLTDARLSASENSGRDLRIATLRTTEELRLELKHTRRRTMGTRQPHLIHRDRGRALAFTAAENTRCDPPPMMTMVEKNERRGQRGERMAEEGCGGAGARSGEEGGLKNTDGRWE